ncbi:MAG: hypothetical protein RLZZ351_1134 [Pseudomonadota bacterium]
MLESSKVLHSQNYVLLPYVDYWVMLLKLSNADKTQIQNYLAEYNDTFFSERIRAEWLKALAKRQDWSTFFEELPQYKREDLAIACYALEGRAKKGDAIAIALTEGKVYWMVATNHPVNCEALFDLMQKSNVLTEDDIWMRFRLALQEGQLPLAKSLLQRLSLSGFIKSLDVAFQNPQQFLDAKNPISLHTRLGRELHLYALDRLMRIQIDSAKQRWEKIASQFSEEESAQMWKRFAIYAARHHDNNALSIYARVKTQYMDKEGLAWKTRVALWNKDWILVKNTIAEMTVEQQEEPVWRYWKARAYKAQNDIPKANQLLLALTRERNYYGLLAEDELGDVLTATPINYVPTESEVQQIQNQPAIQRVLELQRIGLKWESRSEWSWATRDYDDKQLLAAAELALRQGWYDVAINTAERTKSVHSYILRFPTPYRETVTNFSKDYGVDEAWVYGLTRQESRFNPSAKSGVGAAGVMQVMPETAAWIAKRMNLGGYRQDKIHQLDTNVQLGTYYLRYTLDMMNGQTPLATAAYNAGPGRVKNWMADQPIEGAIYVENIPILETRAYVQKVMANTYFYAYRLGTKTQSLKQRLGIITKTSAAIAAE